MAEDNNASNETSHMDELKKKYAVFREKYDLPEFSELNQLFDVEEVDPETEFLLRRVRRLISDKIAGYLRFVELILNPSNAPMFFFNLIKKLEESDKKELTVMYETLGKLELEIIKLDLEYHEEMEAEFIKRIHTLFDKEVSKKLLAIAIKMGNGVGKEKKVESRSYFG